MDRAQQALLALGQTLRAANYTFVTPTPLTHARVLARPGRGSTLRDVFGWSRPFAADALPAEYLDLLDRAEALVAVGLELRATVRFSMLDELLLVHSAYPTAEQDAVFFGPDTYRFARAIQGLKTPGFEPRTIVDIGAGSGAGGLLCGALFSPERLVLTDINRRALRFAEISAALNDVAAEVVESDVLAAFDGQADLIVANPPYLVDAAHRTYRDGGGTWGGELSLRILREGLDRLAPGGKLLLYTGTPVVDGVDQFAAAAQAVLCERGVTYQYEEIDPDVFGEELEQSPYDRADRIAAVQLLVRA